MNVYLVGMPGSGKSEVGRVLADRLGRPFVDLDEAIEAGEGMTPAELFGTKGPDTFRALERDALQRVAQQAEQAPMIVATGGGVVLDEANRKAMRSSGRVVWLEVDVDTILSRVELDGSRPLLRDATDAADLLTQREALYREVADVTVDGTGATDEVAAAVQEAL